MAYPLDTQLALDDLALRLGFATPEPANQLLQPVSSQASPEPAPEDTEHWLRWLRISFGCETG
jgi:hypothetical protein